MKKLASVTLLLILAATTARAAEETIAFKSGDENGSGFLVTPAGNCAMADAANAAAQSASSTASGAQSAANQALAAAQASQSCCDATNEKIDRMFRRSISK